MLRAMRKGTIASLLASGGPLVMPGVWDALSARLAEEAGFRAVLLSGYCLSATRLAEPDVGLVGAAVVIDAAGRVAAAVEIPVVVDVDTGYGNAFNVERIVRELARLGAAGVFLEDQVWPKRCGHMEGKQVVPVEEYLPKLAAALDVGHAADPGFHVTARTDARAVLGLDDAIARARAYAVAGADAVFVEAPRSVEEMDAVRRAVDPRVPLVANMVEQGKTPVRDAGTLAAAGYAMIAVPVAGLLATVATLRDVWAALARDGTTRAVAGCLCGFAELNALLGLEERYRRERAWASRT
jgi:2-methylisocitrate lyase-like PEP mutase family enzyme